MTTRRDVLLVLGVTAAVSVPLVVNPRVHLRDDAMSNTALAHAVRRHGIPPPDPYLAGQPLHYHWAYNALAAGLSAVTGLSPLTVMVVLGPVGLAAGLLGMARLVRWMGGGNAGVALAVALTVVGLNGPGWLLLVVRWLTGDVGVAEAFRLPVSDFQALLVRGYDMRLGLFLSKPLLATSFTWTLALLPFAVEGLLRFVRGEGRRFGVLLVAALAGAAYANLLVGAALMGLAGAGLSVSALVLRGEEGGASRRAAGAVALVLASAALVAPYLAVTVGAAAGREPLVTVGAPDARHVTGALLALLPFWAGLALVGWRRRGRGEAWLLVLAGGLVAGFLAARVVDGVETKFVFAAAVLLAAYLGRRLAAVSVWRRRALWAVAASAVPTTLAGLICVAVAPDEIHLSEAEGETFAWVAERTPPETVVVFWSPGREGRSTLVPILARRDLYVPEVEGFHRAGRYDRAVWDRRTEQMRRLYRPGQMAGVLDEIAADMGRPIILITRQRHITVTDPGLKLLHAAGELRVWQRAATSAQERRDHGVSKQGSEVVEAGPGGRTAGACPPPRLLGRNAGALATVAPTRG